MDADGSGVLDKDEVRAVFADLGVPLTAEELCVALAEMDSDGSGEV
jgi:Ca2+-binding EF-hand superfamily protein